MDMIVEILELMRAVSYKNDFFAEPWFKDNAGRIAIEFTGLLKDIQDEDAYNIATRVNGLLPDIHELGKLAGVTKNILDEMTGECKKLLKKFQDKL